MSSQPEKSIPILARAAIEDAMLSSKRYFTRHVTNYSESECALEQNSQGECKTGSFVAVHLLYTRHQDLFDILAVVTGYEPFKFDPKARWHMYFLSFGKDMMWRAGSPANYSSKPKGNEIDRIISSTRLDDVMSEIQSQDGGNWPSINLLNIVFKEKYTPPFIYPETSIIDVLSVDTYNFELGYGRRNQLILDY